MMKINKKNILVYQKRYEADYKPKDKVVEEEMKRLLKKQRYLRREDLIRIGNWKSPRQKKNYESKENDDMTVKEITNFSFCAKTERARIESLFVLRGVSWRVASAILHFAFPSKYPIWDFRVLEFLGWKKPYSFDLWEKYCDEINKISKKCKLPIRTVEKALWKYSKEHPKN